LTEVILTGIMTRMKSILIVEDDPDIRELLEIGLGFSNDFKITMSPDGEDAWRRIQNSSIDLVVTDFRMPKINGGQLTRLIKEHFPNLPVILISSNHPSDIGIAHLIQAYIPKPFDATLLQLKIESILMVEKVDSEK
jgi:DNA-binding NtrC family response regulator